MSRVVVVAALRAEMPRGLPRLGATGLVVGARAPRLPSPLPGEGPVLVTGTCGALRRGHPPGTLVLATSVEDVAGRLAPHAAWRARVAEAARAAGVRVVDGSFVESEDVVDDAASRAALAAASGAGFVDLESARVARACAAAGREWAVLRVVTDAPEAPLTWLADLLGRMPDEEPSPAEIARALLRRPAALPRLVALGALVARGRRAVRAVVAAISG